MFVAPLIRKAIKTDKPRYDGPTGSPWRYLLTSDFGYASLHLRGVSFKNRWVCIKGGNIVIREGYAWNGCSPCISVLGLFYLGPPDGAQYLGVLATYNASLVHDAIVPMATRNPDYQADSHQDLSRFAGGGEVSAEAHLCGGGKPIWPASICWRPAIT